MASQVRHVRTDMTNEEWAKVRTLAAMRGVSIAALIAETLRAETKFIRLPEKART